MHEIYKEAKIYPRNKVEYCLAFDLKKKIFITINIKNVIVLHLLVCSSQ